MRSISLKNWKISCSYLHRVSARNVEEEFVTKSFMVAHEVEAIVIVSQPASQMKIAQKHPAWARAQRQD